MKNTKFLIFALSILFYFACEKSDDSFLDESLTTTTVIEAINSVTFNEDLDDVINVGMSSKSISGKVSTAKRTLSSSVDPEKLDENRFGDCATIVNDEENNTKTITFSGDCEGKKGQLRQGTIKITFSEERDVIGAFHQIEFIDFYMNNVKIEGVRNREVIDIDSNGNKTVQSTYSSGKMIYEDGTFSTKNSSFTRYFNKDSEEPYSTLSGSSEGVSTEGIPFSMNITTPIKFVYNCDLGKEIRGPKRKGWKIPVEGTKVIDDGTNKIELNYGDGICDTAVDVTTNGVLETVDLKDLKRGDRFKDLFKNRGKLGGGKG
jgi:hypothetical protein